MLTIKNIARLRKLLNQKRKAGKIIGLVPTMGALHQGHLSLIRQAKKESDFVAVSIFVNPIQFGPQEDFKNYPRNLKNDCRLCKKAGADVIFAPLALAMFPLGYKTYVNVEELCDALCGKFRPGHFKGVATVVIKLLNIVQPDQAYFGQKDAQQSVIIKKMASDLNIPVEVKIIPTVREKSGLAMSSRNVYLKKDERKEALILNQALISAKKSILEGNKNSRDIVKKMRQVINASKSGKVQYISIVDPVNLKPLAKIKGKVLLALAVWFGRTRLIDNVIVVKAKNE